MTELQFLIKLLLDSPLDSDTKRIVADRIREVEDRYNTPNVPVSPGGYVPLKSQPSVAQAPSMQRILEQNPDLVPAQPVNTKIIPPKEQEIMLPNGSSIKGPRKW